MPYVIRSKDELFASDPDVAANERVRRATHPKLIAALMANDMARAQSILLRDFPAWSGVAKNLVAVEVPAGAWWRVVDRDEDGLPYEGVDVFNPSAPGADGWQR